MRTSWHSLRQAAARSRARDAFARHWWRIFLEAEDRAEAYAAWVLFKAAADRRAYLWMRSDREAINDVPPLQKLKEVHVDANNWELRRAIEKREEKLPKQFLSREPIKGVGPWGKLLPESI